MALNYTLSQNPIRFAGTGFKTNTEPFADVASSLGMPSLLETASVGPMGLSDGAAYTVPSTDSGSNWFSGLGSQNIGAGLSGASMGMSIGQALGSVYAAWESGKTAKYVGKKQAEIAENNRQMSQMSAESAYRQGENQMAQLTYRAGQTQARQRVAMGANGVRVTGGSANEVLASTEVLKQMDMNSVKLNAISNAWGYKAQGHQAVASGQIAQTMSNYQASSGMTLAMGNLMERSVTVADRWHKLFGGS